MAGRKRGCEGRRIENEIEKRSKKEGGNQTFRFEHILISVTSCKLQSLCLFLNLSNEGILVVSIS